MNNYAIQQVSSTVAGSTIIAGALLVAQLATWQRPEPTISLLSRPQIIIDEHSKTFGQYTKISIGEDNSSRFSFEESVASFYAKLLSKQEPLGKEFEQVLHDNLWDLLVTT